MLEQSNNSSHSSSEEEFVPRKPRNFIQERIGKIKEAVKTLADENALSSPEPLKEEFLHYPASDVENPQNEELENRMVNEFNAQPPEGDNSEECYTYLLLDPRVTGEIQREDANPEEKWRTFVRSIFYVEKGQSLLPNDHLRDAYNFLRSAKNVKSDVRNAGKRMQRIMQIWSEDEGVIVLEAFQFINSAEAHTREAVIIDALGLPSLCNEIPGTYHDGGVVKNLDPDQKLSFGKYLLLKAMREYINSEEIKIFPSIILH
ncbi:ankyrin repeat and LEM domain-containing protein 1-like [Cloeon dipterum]|uniref:ankyrin repeat and LEM domain-containing protein 1-like n=1 Tax=Cloeon dipterum TaxID=197152 RepID=UPI00321F805B